MNPIYPPVYRSSIIVRNPSHNRCSPKSKSKLSVWRIVDGLRARAVNRRNGRSTRDEETKRRGKSGNAPRPLSRRKRRRHRMRMKQRGRHRSRPWHNFVDFFLFFPLFLFKHITQLDELNRTVNLRQRYWKWRPYELLYELSVPSCIYISPSVRISRLVQDAQY